jgi:hypothetical protein
MKIVKKEDLAKLLLDYETPFDERKSLVTGEFEINLPDDIEDGEPFLDFVYDVYMRTVEEYELQTKALYIKDNSKKKGQPTKKSFIIDVIQKRETLMLEELHRIVDSEFKYSESGKNPRTRCRKVLQQLIVENKITYNIEERVIKWKG